MSSHAFVAPLRGIEISDDLGVGIELSDGIVLFNDSNQVDRVTRRYWSLIAPKQLEAIEKAGAFIYGQLPEDVTKDDHVSLLEGKRRHLLSFLTGLWMVRDNAVNGEEVSVIWAGGRTGLTYTHVFLNAKGAGYKGCTSFTRAEIEQAVTFSQWWEEDVLLHDGEEDSTSLTRLSRAGFFLQMARQTSNVGLCTALYCSSIEALVSTGGSGIMYQLAKRVALLLGELPSKDSGIYSTMENIYRRRSDFMHGDDVNRKQGMSLSEASVQCDDILRKVLNKVFIDPLPEHKKALTARFKELRLLIERDTKGANEKLRTERR